MPYASCNNPYTIDPVGKNNPGDFVQVVTGEIVRVRPGDPLITSGKVTALSDSDADQVVVCKCGLMFWDEKHPHFTMAGKEHELYNQRERLGQLESGTEMHVLCEAQIKSLEEAIETAKKAHKPVGTLAQRAEKAAKAKTPKA